MNNILVPQEPPQNPAIVEMLDLVSRAIYGTTRQDAHQRN